MSGDGKNKKRKRSFMRTDLSESDTIRMIDSCWKGNFENSSELNKIHVNFVQYPFPVCVIRDFFGNTEILKSALSELEQVDFYPKNNDLYRFSQTDDLQNLTDFPSIKQLYDVLRTEVSSWLGKVYKKERLHDEIAATFSSYQFGDRLLCHDDKCEDRHIAFVIYLMEEWKEEYGGNLELFSIDSNNYPKKVVETIVPQFNTMVLFEVTPISFHQVSEVLSRNNRLSLNGWFHSERKKVAQDTCEILEFISLPANDNDYNLNHYFLPNYLEYGNQVQIRSRFISDSEIQLEEFLIPTFLEEINADFGSNKIKWDLIGPANIRRYEIADPVTLSPAISTLKDILESRCWFSCLRSITGLDLVPSRSSDMDIWSAGNEPTCRVEIQRWTPGCYSLIHDKDPDFHVKALDVFLRFPFENREQNYSNQIDEDSPETGHIIYIDKDSKDEECLLHIGYKMNSLALIYRDAKTLRFTKYLDSTSEPFYQVACTYQSWSPPSDQPELRHRDSESDSESSDLESGTEFLPCRGCGDVKVPSDVDVGRHNGMEEVICPDISSASAPSFLDFSAIIVCQN